MVMKYEEAVNLTYGSFHSHNDSGQIVYSTARKVAMDAASHRPSMTDLYLYLYRLLHLWALWPNTERDQQYCKDI